MRSPIRSPIEYKSAHHLKQLIEPRSRVSSFFLYSGDIELALAATDRELIAHTTKYPIYEFWAALKDNKERIVAAVEDFYPRIDPLLFNYLQEAWPQLGDPYTRSAFFFILNRCSQHGDVSMGNFDRKRFNPVSLNYLRRFKGEYFYPVLDKEENALDALSTAKTADYLLMPVGKFTHNLFEYGKSRGYEMTSINHRELRARTKEIDKKWILIYKKHTQLFRMYKDNTIYMIDQYGRVTDNKDKCEEMIIANF